MNTELRVTLPDNIVGKPDFSCEFCRKIGDRWRFSDLISYFCNWFRASADGARHIYERFVTFSFTLKLRNFDYPKEM